MGVPSFYRWQCKKYPRIPVDAKGDETLYVNGIAIPTNSALPNPNGVEYDNLYLDMNGIIHPCCHPESGSAPPTEQDMYLKIFDYIDRIFSIVRPRKVLYMAIDGVAPRAKMNQQRQRRFRAAQERFEAGYIEDTLRDQFMMQGKEDLLPKRAHTWDSNVITPGTPFMARLSDALHYYIQERISSDPGWRGVKVIFSDARVPGEGEHKIMAFIRNQRALPDYNPQTQHCLYGMDADLIMLSLASHDPFFHIVREVVLEKHEMVCSNCNVTGHIASMCGKKPEEDDILKRYLREFENVENINNDVIEYQKNAHSTPFQFLRINILREYLAIEMHIQIPHWNLERIIDDWILQCFFVGNDFLPHMPALEIKEGAIDVLVDLYKEVIPTIGRYLTCNGEIDMIAFELLIVRLGVVENSILKKRHVVSADRARAQQKREILKTQEAEVLKAKLEKEAVIAADLAIQAASLEEDSVKGEEEVIEAMNIKDEEEALESGSTVADEIVEPNAKKIKLEADATTTTTARSDNGKKRKNGKKQDITSDMTFQAKINKAKALVESNLGKGQVDTVQLGSKGYDLRYYEEKMGLNKMKPEHQNSLNLLYTSYVEGMKWVFEYYFQGVASWDWYYPFHYSPLVADLVDIDQMKLQLNRQSYPFQPFQQLLSVFPSSSSHALPKSYAKLMTESDSNIADFYPTKFGLDLNGKKYAWQGVVLLPFIDEDRLMESAELANRDINAEEQGRNSLGVDYVYFHFSHELYSPYVSMLSKLDMARKEHKVKNADSTQGDEELKILRNKVSIDVEEVYSADKLPKHVYGMEKQLIQPSNHSRLLSGFTEKQVNASFGLNDAACEWPLASDASPARVSVNIKTTGLAGYLSPIAQRSRANDVEDGQQLLLAPFAHEKLHDRPNYALGCVYTMPPSYVHSSALLPNLILPTAVLDSKDHNDVMNETPDRFKNNFQDLIRISQGGSVYGPPKNYGQHNNSMHVQNNQYQQRQHQQAVNKGYGQNNNYNYNNNNSNNNNNNNNGYNNNGKRPYSNNNNNNNNNNHRPPPPPPGPPGQKRYNEYSSNDNANNFNSNHTSNNNETEKKPFVHQHPGNYNAGYKYVPQQANNRPPPPPPPGPPGQQR